MNLKFNFTVACLLLLMIPSLGSSSSAQETAEPTIAPTVQEKSQQTTDSNQTAQPTTQAEDGSAAKDQDEPKKTPAQIAREKSMAQRAVLRARAKRNREAQRQRKLPWDRKWKRVIPHDSNVSVLLPMLPQEGTNTMTPVKGEPPVKLHQFFSFLEEEEASFRLTYHDLHTVPKTRKEIKETLDRAVEGAAVLVNGELRMNETMVSDEFHGREYKYAFTMTDQRVVQIWARVYLVDNRQYVQSVAMPMAKFDNKLARNYLDSFILNPEPESVTDPFAEPKKGETKSETKNDKTAPRQLKYPDADKKAAGSGDK